MKLPIRISPDRIKDAIVEVRYTSKIPFEVYLGMFYQALDNTYYYTNRPVGNRQFPIDGQREIKLSLGGNFLFFNDHIKFEIQPNSIIFNSKDKYITWERYEPEIRKVLSQLVNANVIDTYTRIGVRYISEYPDMDLSRITKFSFAFGMPHISSDLYTFKSEFNIQEFKVILNLTNKLPVINNLPENQHGIISKISIIDVDVIRDNLNMTDVDKLLQVINETHIKEKELFFSLLNEQFLESLNPEY